MPLPVVTDCYQAVLVWKNTLAQRPATTRMHFFDSGAGTNATDLFAAINTNVHTDMWNVLSTDAVITEVDITKLDGTSAGQTFATDQTAKWSGSSGSDFIPQGACVVSLKSTQRGPRGRNRLFLPWVSETQTTRGTLGATGIGYMQTRWNTFQTAMLTASWGMVVVSGQYNDQHPVGTVVVRDLLKTQRRRARR